ncbi:hypothetical protein AG0111_0g10236 [Alternaria gaisen]|uniref:Uncharacterized protein n=1 Tax=Alternaria gaisen TaxID=167740 RepID=A0ACB6FAP1_9PLEO|nr:hypothetical protein AG0111_0g10236 [Alternaria gaisen]
MSPYFDSYNTSILAIPAYVILTFLPHVLAINVATRGNFLTWDNRNPRSSDLRAQLKQRLTAVTYTKYKRMEACHANGMENLLLFIGAVVLGNIAGLGQNELAKLAAWFLAVRIAYTVAYITTSTQAPTLIRSSLWIAGVSLCFCTIIRAAGVMAAEA